MFLLYFVFFLSQDTFSQTRNEIQVVPNPQTYEDFEHQNKGCPENSECDKVMGHQMSRWKELVTRLKDPKISSSTKASELETFRSKYGIPVEFYTNKKSQQDFKPLFFNSHCKEHNPKKEDERVLKGIAFIKSMNAQKAVVWRDQAMIEVPIGELLLPQPVKVYLPGGDQDFFLPLGDQPLFMKNKNLYVIREDDELFYALMISPQGDWKIVDLDFTRLSEWENKRDNIPCPADKEKKNTSPVFGAEFCKTIWQEELKNPVSVKMRQGCAT